MVDQSLQPFLWVILTFPLVWLLQRWIHTHLRGTMLLLTGKENWSVILYAIILFPGVLLHEASHYLTAIMLGVRTGNVSLLPAMQKDGTLRLGYVEYFKSKSVGPLRESLIGVAPLVYGSIAIILIGRFVFDLPTLLPLLANINLDNLARVSRSILATNDVFLWLYLLFAICNTMMPSPSDRKAWPIVLGILAAFIILLLFLDLQPLLLVGIRGPLATLFGYLALAFGVTVVLDLIAVVVISAFETIIGRIRGASVRYG